MFLHNFVFLVWEETKICYVLVECFSDFVESMKEGDSVAFVTTNVNDFSDAAGDKRQPHADLKSMFDGTRVQYYIDIKIALNDIEQTKLSEEEDKYINLRISQLICQHEFEENHGGWLRSQYGGLTWQLICKKCGALFDTGEYFD